VSIVPVEAVPVPSTAPAPPAPPTAPIPSWPVPTREADGTRAAALRRLRGLHIRDVAVFGVFVAIFAMALRPVVDNDVFWHLATGRYIWATGRVPHADPFSWTAPGRPWIAHEWLTETLLYPLYTHGGYAALMLVFAAAITGAFAVAYATARLLGAARPLALLVTLLAAVASSHTWGVRPQMLSLLLIAVAMALLTRATLLGRPRLLWLLPALMALWVNLHGGFIFGLALIGLYAAGETCEWILSVFRRGAAARGAPWRLWLTLAASVATCLLNPNGARGLLYPFSYLGDNASMRYIAEWVRPDFHQFQYQLFGALLIALVVGVVFSSRRPRATEALLAILFAYLGLRSVRNINLFCVVVAPIIAFYLSLVWRRVRMWATARGAQGAVSARAEGKARPLVETVPAKVALDWLFAAVIVGAVAVVSAPGLTARHNATVQARLYPVGAVAYLRAHRPAGRLFNSYDWGGYLIWNLYPRERVYVDGRPDMYGDRFMDLFVRTWHAQPGWQATLRRADVRLVLVEPRSGLGRALSHAHGWRVAYRDAVSVLYDRAG